MPPDHKPDYKIEDSTRSWLKGEFRTILEQQLEIIRENRKRLLSAIEFSKFLERYGITSPGILSQSKLLEIVTTGATRSGEQNACETIENILDSLPNEPSKYV